MCKDEPADGLHILQVHLDRKGRKTTELAVRKKSSLVLETQACIAHPRLLNGNVWNIIT